MINLKFEFNAINAPNLLSVWQIHFEFEHFIATVPISVILMKNYQITLQLNFKWITSIQKFDSAQYMHQIYWAFDKYTSNLNISLQLSLYQSFQWRTTKYQSKLNFKLNVINLKFEFNAIIAPNLLSVWQIHFEFEHFIATVPISVILI